MPEGDSIRRIADALAPLVGEVVSATSPNPRGRLTGVAKAVDGRRLERVSSTGKNLFLHFEGGVVVRSHLLMSGRWRIEPAGGQLRGKPWLVLEAAGLRASQWHGPVLEVVRGRLRLGLDILDAATAPAALVARLRQASPERSLAEVLVDQRLIAGIGNLWLAEALWRAQLSPRRRLGAVTDDELESLLTWTREEMTLAVGRGRRRVNAYRRAGRPCPRCGTPIVTYRLGEHARSMYVCERCQPG
ncbi:MAG: DNA-formamidopyrimidine glycosylase family protein [Gaiellales bacterium]